MDDDFNTAMTLANLFELSSKINSFQDKLVALNSIRKPTFEKLSRTFRSYILDVLGLKEESGASSDKVEGLMNLIIELRKDVRAKKDFAASDKIRDELLKVGIQVKDGKDGVTWSSN